MKPFPNPFKQFVLAAFLMLAASCATTSRTETFLTAAGFKLVAATTPKQEQKLKSLPADKITMVQRNGKTYYVFPDPTHHQIYLGTTNEYQNYRQIIADNQIAEQDRTGAELASADGSDWSDWGSWEVITWMPN